MNLLFSSEGINVTSIYSNPVLKDEACIQRFLHDAHPGFQYIYLQPPIHFSHYMETARRPEILTTPFLEIGIFIFLIKINPYFASQFRHSCTSS